MAETENIKAKSKKKKATKFVFFIVLIFVISGVSSVISDKYIFPWLATRDCFKNKAFFKQAMENVTVINKTEQITVSENKDISGYTQKSASSVVEIVSRQKGDKNVVLSELRSASGTIVASDGLVASYGNNFFGGMEIEYEIFLQDGKSYSAKIAGVDPFSNIVLLKMEGAENLPVAQFIAPEDIKTGMKIAAVGRSGFNAEISLRLGVTSEWAKATSVSGPLASSEKLQGVLFADFSRADDTSDISLAGGAAVDQNGNMVGLIGERKEDAGEKFFVVPINHLQYVINEFLGKGKIERASLGLYYASLSKETAFFAGNSFDRGALVYSPSGQQGLAVLIGSAADKAGIQIGDVILSVNGEEVNPDQNLAFLISKYKPGETVGLKLNRDGKEMEVRVVLQ